MAFRGRAAVLNLLVAIDKRKLAATDGKVVKADQFAQMLEAQEIVAAARRYASELRASEETSVETARQAGYAEGARRAREDHATSVVETTARLESAFLGLEARIVNTIMNALQRVLLEMDDRQVIESLVRRVLGEAKAQKQLRLRVSALQFEQVNAALAAILRDFPDVEFIDVVKDPRAASGTCVLESEFGVVDASLETQLAAVRRGLISAFIGKRQRTSG
jgi:type III secretion protein L